MKKKEMNELLLQVNEQIKTKRGEMVVQQIYKQMELEEMLNILREKRKDILSSTLQTEQLTQSKQSEQLKERKQIKETKENIGIPFFWVKVLYTLGLFMNYPQSEEDIIALSYLNDIRINTLSPSFDSQTQTIKMGKEIIFSFDSNPFFTNKLLIVHMKYRATESLDIIEQTCRLIPKTSITWKVNLIEINPSSIFNVFLPNNDHELEDFLSLESAFYNFDVKVMKYFYEF